MSTINIHSDLIKRCKRNDQRAQMQLYDLYAKAMYNTAMNFVKDSAVAEDMMQEGFIKAFRKIDSFNQDVSFGTWLKRIVINQCLDWLKKRKLKIVNLEESQVKSQPEDDWQIETAVSMSQIKEAIENLPESNRIVVKLFLLEGYDHQEISQILGISEVNSRSLLHRGKLKLKEQLKTVQYA
ncbi:sigma-70 family RNA polymerase sigma factor [Flavobacteriaceae bacterium F08102]|nr:sigma-70 family RNA polymerase sigma factor [Flavobacteriaceae bacterium F08102]